MGVPRGTAFTVTLVKLKLNASNCVSWRMSCPCGTCTGAFSEGLSVPQGELVLVADA